MKTNRRIVIVNQAANYLTIGLSNAFSEYFQEVSLVTGSIHEQGEKLNPCIKVVKINSFKERPTIMKFLSYLIACVRILWLLKTKYRRNEVLFVSLPPMAYLINLIVKNKFSMIIWDVYPDLLKITGMKDNNVIYKCWAFLNRRSFNKAEKIFTIGNNIAESLSQYIEKDKIIIQPIWSIFQDTLPIDGSENVFIKKHELYGKFVVQYSGNIGLTHKVELVINIAERLIDEKNIVFQIIGRGPRVPVLKNMVEKKNLPNCIFLPFQDDEMFHHSLSATNLGIVILNEAVSKGSVPSKAYNLMSLGIPSIYFAARDSELCSYAQKYNNAVCFSEKQIDEASTFVLNLSRNKKQWDLMSCNAFLASKDFRRCNADRFVEKYIEKI